MSIFLHGELLMKETLFEWSEWASNEGKDSRDGRRIWAWLYRHNKPILKLAFYSREPASFA
jgi:hypothetical protein